MVVNQWWELPSEMRAVGFYSYLCGFDGYALAVERFALRRGGRFDEYVLRHKETWITKQSEQFDVG
jgi:hypothetical protein